MVDQIANLFVNPLIWFCYFIPVVMILVLAVTVAIMDYRRGSKKRKR